MTESFVTSDQVTISPDDAVDGASGIIRAYCGWHIWPQVAATVQVAPRGGHQLVLPTLNLVSVTSITVNGDALDLSTVTVWPSGVIERNPDQCDSQFWRDPDFWPWHGTVTVEFTHGYENVPPEIKAVCQSLASRWPASASQWTRRRMGSSELAMTTGAGVVPVGSLTVVEQMVLDRYTLPRRP